MLCICMFAERVKRGDNFVSPSLALYCVKAFRRLLLIPFSYSGVIFENLVTEEVDTFGNRVNTFIRFNLQPDGFHSLMNEGANLSEAGFIRSQNPLVVAIPVIIFHTVFRLQEMVENNR